MAWFHPVRIVRRIENCAGFRRDTDGSNADLRADVFVLKAINVGLLFLFFVEVAVFTARAATRWLP
jgi:hypothetical protein